MVIWRCLTFLMVPSLGSKDFFRSKRIFYYSRLIDEERHVGFVNLTSFYVRRFFRIIPAAFVFLVTVGILACYDIVPMSIGRWLSSLFFLANYSNASGSYYVGHFWSPGCRRAFLFSLAYGVYLVGDDPRSGVFCCNIRTVDYAVARYRLEIPHNRTRTFLVPHRHSGRWRFVGGCNRAVVC